MAARQRGRGARRGTGRPTTGRSRGDITVWVSPDAVAGSRTSAGCAEAVLRVLPAHPIGHRVRIAALHALGRMDQAVAAGHPYRAALADKAGVDEATIRKRTPDPGFAERFDRALRECGLPG